jgi:hypothetical protein
MCAGRKSDHPDAGETEEEKEGNGSERRTDHPEKE